MGVELIDKPWESGWLGKPTYSLSLSGNPSSEDIQQQLDVLARPCFVATRIDATAQEYNHLLQIVGFKVIEAYIELARNLADLEEPQPIDGVYLANSADREQASEIARTSFAFEREENTILPLLVASILDPRRWSDSKALDRSPFTSVFRPFPLAARGLR